MGCPAVGRSALSVAPRSGKTATPFAETQHQQACVVLRGGVRVSWWGFWWNSSRLQLWSNAKEATDRVVAELIARALSCSDF